MIGRVVAGCLLLSAWTSAMAGIDSVRLVPVTPRSVIFGSAQVAGAASSVDLAARGYIEEEYFIGGKANAYERDARDELRVRTRDVPYVTRVIVRRPRDLKAFSGTVVVEPIHPSTGGTLAWTAAADYLIRSGHIYLALGTGDDPPTRELSRSGAPVAADLVARWFDPERYRDFIWPTEDGIRWDVMSDMLRLFEGNDERNPLRGYAARRFVATGWSFTGSLLRTFINEGFHERARNTQGGPLVSGYLIGISSRWNGGGYLPLNSSTEALPIAHPRRALREIDAPVIEFLTANEVASGTGEQRPDTDAARGGHRLYELGASNHGESFDAAIGGRAQRTHLTQLRAKGHPSGALAGEECKLPTSDVPIGELTIAALDNLITWSRGGAAPPRAQPLRLTGDGRFSLDGNGNPQGGIRIAEFDVPRARYDTSDPEQRKTCAVPRGRTPFYRFDFSAEQMRALYPQSGAYLAAYQKRIAELVAQRWLLEPEAERLIARAQAAVPEKASFGHYRPVKLYSEQSSRSFYLPMRDGVQLAVRVSRPARGGRPIEGRFPVIWHHTLSATQEPADGTGPRAGGYRSLPGLTDYGYVVVQVARRGNGQSFGVRRGYHERNEAYDAYDITEWLASQSWSTGVVGIYGCSNTGDAAMHAISVRPPHLKAAFAGCFSWNKYDAMRRGGIFAQWGTGPQRTIEQDMAVEPVEGDGDKRLLRRAAEEHQLSTSLYELWKGMPYRDSHSTLVGSRFWAETSVSSYADQLRRSGVALYIQGAWFDEFRDQGLITHLNMPGSRVLIGPWKHCENPGFELVQEMHRFFDFHLKGIDTGIALQAPIHYYTMNAAADTAWRSTARWPLADSRMQRLHLGSAGRLDAVAPRRTSGSTFRVQTALSCPEAGSGSTIQPCHVRDAGISFAGAPLEKQLEVTGEVAVQLSLASSRTDANVFAYLEDVAPDGRVTFVTEGRLKASLRAETEAPYPLTAGPWHRGYREDAQPLVPGEPVTLRFAMLPTSYVFRAGHRLQVTITGADHRERDRAPDTEGSSLTILFGGNEASFVDLPTIAIERG